MSFLSLPAFVGGARPEAHDADLKKSSSRTAAPPKLSLAVGLSPLARLVVQPANIAADIYNGLKAAVGPTAEERFFQERRALLRQRLAEATTYEAWKAAATELDVIEGNNDWKELDFSPDYNARLIEARLKQLDEAREQGNVPRMLFLIRTALTRNLGDMGNVKLYNHSYIGTKKLVERYNASVLNTLEALHRLSLNNTSSGLSSKHIHEEMLRSRQAFGRSALLLSGGATYGMNHIGVLKALWDAKLLPRIISGASAGSIVCSVLCSKTDDEIPEILESFAYGDMAVFGDPDVDDTMMDKLVRFFKTGSWIDISHLIRVLRGVLGEMTFQEAYNRTRRILNITVSSASMYELPRLLNYVTAPNVLIWSAVASSCSVPFVFSAAQLLVKDAKGDAVPWDPSPPQYIDGSVENDLPMTRLAEMFNVNHFIVSQVNPHVVPFLAKTEEITLQEAETESTSFFSGPLMSMAKHEVLYRLDEIADAGIFPTTFTKVRSVLSQRYSGDITIFPKISYKDFPRLLANPTVEFMLQAQLCGERATWPKLSRIRNHLAIELALDEAVQKFRTRVVFSPSQVNLRQTAWNAMTAGSRKNDLAKSTFDVDKGTKTEMRKRRSIGSYDTLGNVVDFTNCSPDDGPMSRSTGDIRSKRRASVNVPMPPPISRNLTVSEPESSTEQDPELTATTSTESCEDSDYISEDSDDEPLTLKKRTSMGSRREIPRLDIRPPSGLELRRLDHLPSPVLVTNSGSLVSGSPDSVRRNMRLPSPSYLIHDGGERSSSAGYPFPNVPQRSVNNVLQMTSTETLNNPPISRNDQAAPDATTPTNGTAGYGFPPLVPGGLSLDLSGTRGMMMRKKMSSSAVSLQKLVDPGNDRESDRGSWLGWA